ncbi:MAG: cell wall-binding repeat-containing protein, partial [Clostridium sp.]|nr:cell wall-binding repeat-containing protein [Clostridium sp.]
TLISIKVTKVPDKTVYRQGEPLDLTGLEVTGFFDDGSETLLPVIQEHISGHSMMEVDPARVLTVTFEGLKAYFTIRVDPVPSVGLIAGYNRFETAAMVAEASYDVTDTAIIVQARNFPDALAAGPLATALNAPILLTDTKALEYYTPDTLHQLRVKKVILMGGELVISKAVEDELKKTYQVERIAGATRYDTALKAAEYLKTLKGTPQSAVITSGTSFADALSAGSYAAINGFPMILTDGKTLTGANTSYLKDNQITNVTILGGETIISASIENNLKEQGIEVERIFGTTRVDTSAKFAQRYFPECTKAIAANGWTFADALSAIPYAAKQQAPILLVRQNYVDQVMTSYLKDSAIHLVIVIGGNQVVSEKVRNDLWLAIQ